MSGKKLVFVLVFLCCLVSLSVAQSLTQSQKAKLIEQITQLEANLQELDQNLQTAEAESASLKAQLADLKVQLLKVEMELQKAEESRQKLEASLNQNKRQMILGLSIGIPSALLVGIVTGILIDKYSLK